MTKEQDLKLGKIYDLNWFGLGMFVERDKTSSRFFPIDNPENGSSIDGLIGFAFGHSEFQELDTNDTLTDMITEDIHNLWLDAPKIVQEVLEKYLEECRFDEFVALEAERTREENDLHNLESARQEN